MGEPFKQSAEQDTAKRRTGGLNRALEEEDKASEQNPLTPEAGNASVAGVEVSESGAVRERFENGWSLVSVVCLIVAVPCLLTGQFNAAFVVATLGVVSWFLNIRSRLKRAQPAPDDYFDDDESVYERDRDED